MSTAPEKVPSVTESLDWRAPEITDLLVRALAEDIGSGDLTTEAVLPEPAAGVGRLVAKEALVVAGLPVAGRIFQLLDPAAHFRTLVEDGVLVSRGVRLAEVQGDARALLRGERTALNFLQRLSGIATLTRRFVFRLRGTRAQLRDTRKTTPGLRQLERYAVRVGGGLNHRAGLFDAVLIKDNHAALAGGVAAAVRGARQTYGPDRPLQIEVRDAVELLQALEAGANALLLDNMNLEQVDLAMEEIRRHGGMVAEVSGGIRLENVRGYAECGVDYISVGALTHSAPAADISFDLEPARNLPG